jgi:hypothetical protein
MTSKQTSTDSHQTMASTDSKKMSKETKKLPWKGFNVDLQNKILTQLRKILAESKVGSTISTKKKNLAKWPSKPKPIIFWNSLQNVTKVNQIPRKTQQSHQI